MLPPPALVPFTPWPVHCLMPSCCGSSMRIGTMWPGHPARGHGVDEPLCQPAGTHPSSPMVSAAASCSPTPPSGPPGLAQGAPAQGEHRGRPCHAPGQWPRLCVSGCAAEIEHAPPEAGPRRAPLPAPQQQPAGLRDGKHSLSLETSRLDLTLPTKVSLPGPEGGDQGLCLGPWGRSGPRPLPASHWELPSPWILARGAVGPETADWTPPRPPGKPAR